jgi:hypothetical protein
MQDEWFSTARSYVQEVARGKGRGAEQRHKQTPVSKTTTLQAAAHHTKQSGLGGIIHSCNLQTVAVLARVLQSNAVKRSWSA